MELVHAAKFPLSFKRIRKPFISKEGSFPKQKTIFFFWRQERWRERSRTIQIPGYSQRCEE